MAFWLSSQIPERLPSAVMIIRPQLDTAYAEHILFGVPTRIANFPALLAVVCLRFSANDSPFHRLESRFCTWSVGGSTLHVAVLAFNYFGVFNAYLTVRKYCFSAAHYRAHNSPVSVKQLRFFFRCCRCQAKYFLHFHCSHILCSQFRAHFLSHSGLRTTK